MTAQRRFSKATPAPISLLNPRFGLLFSLGLAFGILVFLVAASGALPSAVVHADGIALCSAGGGPPCTLGPNLELSASSETDNFPGSCNNGTGTINDSATDPSYTQMIASCLGVHGLTGTTSLVTTTFSLAGLNGYKIEDFGATILCGVTGGDSMTLTFSSLVLTCPQSTGSSATGEITLTTPVLDATSTLTVSVTGVSGGAFSFGGYTESVSLLAPSTVPEPSTLLLLSTGLFGLLGISRRRLGR